MAYPSAAQVISPAIERTKLFLFKPFRMGRFLKLTLVAALVEGGSAGIGSSGGFPSGSSPNSKTTQQLPHIDWPAILHWIGEWMAVVVALVLMVFLIGILIRYLLIRLRFSYFDCVLRQQDQIGPAWSIYHRQALRYLGLSLLAELGFWILLIPIGYALYEHFKPLIHSWMSGHSPDLWSILPVFAVIFPLILLLSLLAAVAEIVLSCFVLPRMALEDASIGDALGDVWGDIVREPGAFAFFTFMRLLLSLAGGFVGVVAIIVPAILIVLIGVIFALIVKSLSTAMAFVLGIPLGILAVGFLILVGIGVRGTIGTFLRNYALLFYGGRYPILGSMLPPPVPSRVRQPGYAPPPNPASGI